MRFGYVFAMCFSVALALLIGILVFSELRKERSAVAVVEAEAEAEAEAVMAEAEIQKTIVEGKVVVVGKILQLLKEIGAFSPLLYREELDDRYALLWGVLKGVSRHAREIDDWRHWRSGPYILRLDRWSSLVRGFLIKRWRLRIGWSLNIDAFFQEELEMLWSLVPPEKRRGRVCPCWQVIKIVSDHYVGSILGKDELYY